MNYLLYSQLDALADLYVFVASLVIGLLALLRWKSGPLRFWFAMNCFLACIWSLSDAASSIGFPSLFLFFLRLGSIGWIFLGPTLFIFLAYFLGREDLVQARRRRLLLLALAVPFWAAFVVSPGFFSSILRSPYDGDYLMAPNSYFSFILVSVIGWAVAQVWILFRSLRRQFDLLIRRRSRILLLLLAGMTALGITTDVILPALNYDAFSLGGILDGLFCMTVFAMIQRFQLLPSAQTLHAKVDQLREFNRTLEQKVEERTGDLRESEQRYREIFENVQDFVFALDLEGRLTSANPQMERVTGVREKEVVGRSQFEVIGKNYPPQILENWNRDWTKLQAQIRAPGNFYRKEVLLPTPSGEERNVVFTWSGIFREGKLTGYLGLGRDVTESQRAEEALRESETRHREIFESVQEFILALDLEGRITSANPQVKKTIGFKTDRLVGKKLAELIEEYLSPQLLEHWKKIWREIQATVQKPGDLFREEVFMPIASGEFRTFVFIYSGIFREGRLVGYLHIGRDVTESQRAGKALQESEARFREIFESAQDVIFSEDLEGRITSMNPRIQQVLGLSPEDFIGKTFIEIVDNLLPDFNEPLHEFWKQKVLAIQKPQDVYQKETSMPVPSGENLILLMTFSGIFREGKLVGYLGIARDITESVKLKKALEEYSVNLEQLVAERTRELEATYSKLAESARQAGMAEMAAGVLHNLGNAINSIGVRLEMVRAHICDCPMEKVLRAVEFLEQHQDRLVDFFREDPKGKQVLPYLKELAVTTQPVRAQMRETVEFVRGKVQHIAEIISVEQRYHRPGQLTEPADLNQVIRESFSLVQDSLQRRGVHVEQDLAELPLLNLDRSQTIQVVFNLLKNAAEALEKNPEGERRLRVQSRFQEEPAPGLVMTVEDNGVGIRPENLPRLFEFGFTTRANRGGHGFGLHASANYIQSAGGRIEAASPGPGQGSVFRVFLPLGDHQEKITGDFEKEEYHEPAHLGH